MTNAQENLAAQFFEAVAGAFQPHTKVDGVVVTHLLADRPAFLRGVDHVATVRAVVPKPRSVDPNVRSWLAHRYRILNCSREDIARDPEQALANLTETAASGISDRRFVLLDIGGYFAPLLSLQGLSESVAGIVEDTENGAQKYEQIDRKNGLTVPVISVARSPLKDPEDYLVGQSIVFSAEALMRERGEIVHGRTACVVGYGKLGRSIAAMLHARRLRVTVYDVDPIRQVEAMAHGFPAPGTLAEALHGNEFVFCATGNRALKAGDFERLRHGACVATVTSPDDELDLKRLPDTYRAIHESEFVTRYRGTGHEFYLLNRGQAVNFLHGAVVGPFIFLVQAEIIASVSRLAGAGIGPGLHENPIELRRRVAEIWCRYYGAAPSGE